MLLRHLLRSYPSSPIGFKHWKHPFPETYLGISGAKGQFLGFWAVIMQASFSFFGSEVPGIVCGPTRLYEVT